ncbi:hypothetical protein [Bradyrhizobium sp. sBnM-33]|uniref:hypothetical protein n=1 Tax=Bradyrhizobium sp. sBnM-33 TaxID=2831780 RepID=UPI001BCCA4DE|nr:hypothetical protein [Bradyrhizobium sp. sBnM-33]WOH49639.1 hypothetical protein RX328_37185 [Bradyrhizobium sp. sBnM-33]
MPVFPTSNKSESVWKLPQPSVRSFHIAERSFIRGRRKPIPTLVLSAIPAQWEGGRANLLGPSAAVLGNQRQEAVP